MAEIDQRTIEESYRDKDVLITGGLGFIGSSLAIKLVSLGARVTLFDALIPEYGGNRYNIKDIEGEVSVEVADVRDREAIVANIKGKDYLFNLAGQVSHSDSMADPMTDLEINCRSQLSILEACRHNNPGVKVVFAATRQEYGRPEYLPVDEKHLLTPTDVNGINKVAGEHYHLLYNDVYDIRCASLRLTNTYGPRQLMKHNRQGFVYWFIRQAIEAKEIQIFVQARRHLPSSVFDEARWRGLVGDKLWPKVVYVLNRGGRFQELAKGAMPGGQTGNPYGRFVNMFQEKTAGVKNSQTGILIPGWATYISAPRDIAGKVINDEGQGYDLRLITFREICQCKSRTISNHWLTALLPENSLIINQSDADLQGLKDGDLATVISATNTEGVYDLKNGQKWPMTGKVKVIQGMRPGVVAFSLGHGHFAYGGLDITIDGQIIKGEKRRVAGVHANAAMRIDPILGNTCLVDTVGGSAVFYDTQVRLQKVSA